MGPWLIRPSPRPAWWAFKFCCALGVLWYSPELFAKVVIIGALFAGLLTLVVVAIDAVLFGWDEE